MEASQDLPISGLQHMVYCDRQAALIHVERIWQENVATAEGRVLHERADLPGVDERRGVRLARSVVLRSQRLGVFGRADLVELHEDPRAPATVRPFPVEMKRGAMKHLLADQVQLCAQAYCLEEQFGVELASGALYYGASHRRVEVHFDEALRRRTEETARAFHRMIEGALLPPAVYIPKRCEPCSLKEACQPRRSGAMPCASEYVRRLIEEAEG